MSKPSTTMTSREFDQDAARAKRAAMRGPVFITEREHPSHVLLSLADYEELTEDSPRFAGPPRFAAEARTEGTSSLYDVLCRMDGASDIDFEIPPRDEMPGEPAIFD